MRPKYKKGVISLLGHTKHFQTLACDAEIVTYIDNLTMKFQMFTLTEETEESFNQIEEAIIHKLS